MYPNNSVILRLKTQADQRPKAIAVAQAVSGNRYKTITFAELERNSNTQAARFIKAGVQPGMRLVLMTKPGIDFTTNVFAIYKAGAVVVLIDPGMGISQMIKCLMEAKPNGFVGPLFVQLARLWHRKKFPDAQFNFSPKIRAVPGTQASSLQIGDCNVFQAGEICDESVNFFSKLQARCLRSQTEAAIIFTSGSTGVAKGVLFTHEIFETQVEEIAARYNIQAGDVDLACFPFFGLFNAAMGVTAVIPQMNSTKPASVKPENILRAVRDWNVVQSFGSPALWNRVTEYCLRTHQKLESLRRVIIAGAPISPRLLEKVRACINPEGEAHTPYGATEALPVASIGANDVLGKTDEQTRRGAGICVGTRFSGIDWKVIPISDEPIINLSDVIELPNGTIGELIVSGKQVTKCYVTRTEANAYAKITDENGNIWHRMGDVGYIDADSRFWFCGRKSHRVVGKKNYYTIPCEAIFNNHPKVSRSALVGVDGMPVIVIEPKKGCFPKTEELLELGKANPLTEDINTILFHPAFPVDVRHNAKINREKLAIWAKNE